MDIGTHFVYKSATPIGQIHRGRKSNGKEEESHEEGQAFEEG
jgi:hypothetical protein